MPTKTELKTVLALVGTRVTHVSEVSDADRGLCRCARCRGFLVPRRGKVNRHHFAHREVCACDGGQETAIHLFAKDALLRRATLRLPPFTIELRCLGDLRSRRFQDGMVVAFDSVELEKPMDGFKPDAVGTKSGRLLAVEFANTHASGSEKVARLAAAGMPAVEVEVSGFPLDAYGAALEDWVLLHAPRAWLWHSREAQWRQGFQAEVDAEEVREAARVAEATRRAEAQRAEAARREAARLARLARKEATIAQVIRDRLRLVDLNRADPRVVDWVAVNGLDMLVGVEVPGSAYFLVDEVVWQCAVIERVVMAAVDGGAVFPAFRVADIVRALYDLGHIPPVLMELDHGDVALAKRLDPRFVGPDAVVFGYMDLLHRKRLVTVRMEGGSVAWHSSPTRVRLVGEREDVHRTVG